MAKHLILIVVALALTTIAGNLRAEDGVEIPWGDDAWEDVGPPAADPDRDDLPPEADAERDHETDTDRDAPAEDTADQDDREDNEDLDTEETAPDPSDQGDPDEPDDQDEPDDPRVEEWRAALLYGIDELVIEALTGMIAASQPGLGRETADLLEETRNDEVRAKGLQYLRTTEDARGAESALSLLQQDLDGEVVREAIRYLRDVQPEDPELAERRVPLIFRLVTERSLRTAQVAVRAIGSFGGADEARKLAELFNDLPSGSQQLQGEILLALGDIGSEDAVPFLIQILEDPVYGSLLRRYAADGLGRSGDERALPVLRKAAESDDSNLKAYAVGALAQFEDADTVETLRRSIRDSNALVRRFAIEGLGRNKVEDAVPALIFQVRRDPEMQVRLAAVQSLAMIGNREAISFLHEQYQSSSAPIQLRNQIASSLIEHHLEQSTETLFKVMEEEWSRRDSRILEHLARTLSESENDALDTFYERMLEHPNFVIQIYAVRGISRNRMSGFQEELEKRAEDDARPALKRSAQAALDQLGN